MGNPHPRKSASSPCNILSRPHPSKKIIKPLIRVVQIHNPVYVQTDAINFPSLVQKLTGRNARLPISQQPHPHPHRSSAADVFNHPHSSSLDDKVCRWSCTDDSNQSHTSRSDQICHWSSGDDFNQPQYTSPYVTSRSYEICHWSSSADDVTSPDEIYAWKNSGAALQRRRRRSSCQCPKSCSGFQNDASSYEASSPNNTSGSSEGLDYEYGDAVSNMSVGVQSFSELDIWAGLASDHALPDITMLPPLLF